MGAEAEHGSYWIRRGRRADAPDIAQLRAAAWRTAYRGIVPAAVLDAMDIEGWTSRAESWLDEDEGLGLHWVAESSRGILGWATRRVPARDPDLDGTVAELVALYVRPDHWGRGVGAGLVAHVLAAARASGRRAVSLWVLEHNHQARRLYQRQGFRLDEVCPKKDEGLGDGIFSVRYLLEL